MGTVFYTGGGDWGETSLNGGRRVPKDDIVVEVLGLLDQVNAEIAVTKVGLPDSLHEIRPILDRTQDRLFSLGAEVASLPDASPSSVLLGEEDLREVERDIDHLGRHVGELHEFVVPGGCATSARLHLVRTMVRGAERAMVSLGRVHPVRHEAVVYLNRLSSLFFVLALWANRKDGYEERAPRYLHRGEVSARS